MAISRIVASCGFRLQLRRPLSLAPVTKKGQTLIPEIKRHMVGYQACSASNHSAARNFHISCYPVVTLPSHVEFIKATLSPRDQSLSSNQDVLITFPLYRRRLCGRKASARLSCKRSSTTARPRPRPTRTSRRASPTPRRSSSTMVGLFTSRLSPFQAEPSLGRASSFNGGWYKVPRGFVLSAHSRPLFVGSSLRCDTLWSWFVDKAQAGRAWSRSPRRAST